MASVDEAVKSTGLQAMPLPENMTTEDFTRAVAVATVSVLRQANSGQSLGQSPARARVSGTSGADEHAGGHGGHEGPSWSRTMSASVLLVCTALYAIIAGKLLAMFRSSPLDA
jgi:Ca2+:H+ antiporter